MSSAPDDMVALVYATFQTAYRARAADLKAAAGQPDLQATILDNVDRLELAWLKAANAVLTDNGPAIEAAYQAAKAASAQVDQAYRSELAINQRIRAVSAAADAATDLVNKASGSA